MRAVVLIMSTLFALSALADQQGGKGSADLAAIEKLYQSWRTAVQGSDIPGYVNVLHADVRLLPPGADAIQGARRYAEFLQPVFDTATYRIEVHRYPQIEVYGNTAVAEYDYTIHLSLKNPQVGIAEPGALTASATTARYFDVLRKDNGAWRVWRHSWQTYEPAD